MVRWEAEVLRDEKYQEVDVLPFFSELDDALVMFLGLLTNCCRIVMVLLLKSTSSHVSPKASPIRNPQ